MGRFIQRKCSGLCSNWHKHRDFLATKLWFHQAKHKQNMGSWTKTMESNIYYWRDILEPYISPFHEFRNVKDQHFFLAMIRVPKDDAPKRYSNRSRSMINVLASSAGNYSFSMGTLLNFSWLLFETIERQIKWVPGCFQYPSMVKRSDYKL